MMLAQKGNENMIKVAVISDLHGNIEALESVFADINSQGIQKVLILGDLAIMGPEPNEAINFVRKLPEKYEIEIIQGNTDLMIVNEGIPDFPPFIKNAIQYAKDTVTPDNKEFLKNLPQQKSIKIGETSILMVHGSPRKQDENILPAKSVEEIRPMLDEVKEALILCGHTHLPAGYQIDKQTIVNDGSVGRPLTGDQKACYVVLDIDETKKDSFAVEHRFIDFDIETAAKKLGAQPFEGAKKLEDMLLRSSAS